MDHPDDTTRCRKIEAKSMKNVPHIFPSFFGVTLEVDIYKFTYIMKNMGDSNFTIILRAVICDRLSPGHFTRIGKNVFLDIWALCRCCIFIKKGIWIPFHRNCDGYYALSLCTCIAAYLHCGECWDTYELRWPHHCHSLPWDMSKIKISSSFSFFNSSSPSSGKPLKCIRFITSSFLFSSWIFQPSLGWYCKSFCEYGAVKDSFAACG